MRINILMLVFSIISTSVICQPLPVAITHVTVIDATGTPPQQDRTVLIINGRISKIGSSDKKVRGKCIILDAKGKFLIPGLWDAHVHALWDSSRATSFFPLFIANGVTSVREMGGPMPAIDQVQWRNKIASGEIVGPRLFVPGPFVDGPRPTWPGSIALHDATGTREAVDSLKKTGVDFIKVYSGVPREAYFAMAQEAKKQQIPFEGHVPLEISAEETSDSGQKSVEHLMGILLGCSSKCQRSEIKIYAQSNSRELEAGK